MSHLVVNDLYKAYGDVAAVDGIDLEVAEGTCLALLGPSGCGKTTLLRLIAGLLTPDKGSINLAGQKITHMPVHERKFGFVFQNYALFPHMTVSENVEYGLRVRGVARDKRRSQASEALERVGLRGVEKRFPNQLSGGQQQRVALARAIVIQPRLLLLDEPLGALDKNLREEMQVELRRIQKSVGITTIFVTHDQEEAMTLSDKVAVLRNGKILQVGSPQEIYDHPQNQFVASFLGTTNFLSGRVVSADPSELVVAIGDVTVKAQAGKLIPVIGETVQVAVRPEKLNLSTEREAGRIRGIVTEMLFQGHRVIIMFRADDGTEMRVFMRPGQTAIVPGGEAFIWWNPTDAATFAAQ